MNDEKCRRDTSGYSSPACLAHEMDGLYGGFLSNAELIERLNALHECELAGEKAARALAAESPTPEARTFLESFARDAAHFATMFRHLIESLGGAASECSGTSPEKPMAGEGFAERLTFLYRGQDCVVRKLQDILPRIRDDRAHAALKGMLGAREANIARSAAIVEPLRNR